MAGKPHVRMLPNHAEHWLKLSTDIIALLIVGVIMVGLFLAWEYKLERIVDDDPSRAVSFWTPPPLMRLSLWTRERGRMAVILVIAFLNWSAFIGWSFWVQVCSSSIASGSEVAHSVLAVLSKLLVVDAGRNHDPIHSHVHSGLLVQLFRGDGRCQIALGVIYRQVASLWNIGM